MPFVLQGTFYGQQSDQDAAGACSYGKNFANSTKMPWSSNADMTVALNDAQWELGAGCGLCVRFRGTGAGIGTTPIATSHWQTGFVNNRCGLLPSACIDLNDSTRRILAAVCGHPGPPVQIAMPAQALHQPLS